MLLAFDQPLCAAEPSGSVAHLSSECEIHAQPEGAAHCAHRFAGVQVRLVSTLQEAQALIVMADHGSRRCEQLEVLRSQWSRLIGLSQRLEGSCPCPP